MFSSCFVKTCNFSSCHNDCINKKQFRAHSLQCPQFFVNGEKICMAWHFCALRTLEIRVSLLSFTFYLKLKFFCYSRVPRGMLGGGGVAHSVLVLKQTRWSDCLCASVWVSLRVRISYQERNEARCEWLCIGLWYLYTAAELRGKIWNYFAPLGTLVVVT